MKDVIFGFGWELSGFILYFLVWGWLCTLLEARISYLKEKVFLTSAIAAVMLHPFVVNYLVVGFWVIMSFIGFVLWAGDTKEYIEDKASWIGNKNFYMLSLIIFVIAFILLRNLMFQNYPDKIWYR
jgi:biotin transporter BioY